MHMGREDFFGEFSKNSDTLFSAVRKEKNREEIYIFGVIIRESVSRISMRKPGVDTIEGVHVCVWSKDRP